MKMKGFQGLARVIIINENYVDETIWKEKIFLKINTFSTTINTQSPLGRFAACESRILDQSMDAPFVSEIYGECSRLHLNLPLLVL